MSHTDTNCELKGQGPGLVDVLWAERKTILKSALLRSTFHTEFSHAPPTSQWSRVNSVCLSVCLPSLTASSPRECKASACVCHGSAAARKASKAGPFLREGGQALVEEGTACCCGCRRQAANFSVVEAVDLRIVQRVESFALESEHGAETRLRFCERSS